MPRLVPQRPAIPPDQQRNIPHRKNAAEWVMYAVLWVVHAPIEWLRRGR